MIYLHARGLYHVLLLICNRELLFVGKRKDEDDMAKSTKTYEERIRALEKKEQESIEKAKSYSTEEGTGKERKPRKVKKEPTGSVRLAVRWNQFLAVRLRRKIYQN